MKSKLRTLFRLLVVAPVALFCANPESRADESQWPLSSTTINSSANIDAESTAQHSDAVGRDSIRIVGSSLAVVLGVFFLISALFRKPRQRVDGSSLLETLGQVQVAPKVKLHLVRFGSRLLVLHITPNSVERVAEISDPDEVQRLLGDHGEANTVHPQVDELLQAVHATAQSPSRGLVG